jgi:hypothetical protein
MTFCERWLQIYEGNVARLYALLPVVVGRNVSLSDGAAKIVGSLDSVYDGLDEI